MTGIDFFSNIPDEIKELIESQTYTSPDPNKNPNPIVLEPDSLSSNLLASVGSNSDLVVEQIGTFDEFSVGQSSFTEESIVGLESMHSFGTTRSSLAPVNFREIDAGQISSSQESIGQTRPFQIRTSQIAVDKVDLSQIRKLKVSTPQTSSSQIGVGEIGQGEISSGQVSTSHLGFSQIDFNQRNSVEIGSTQDNVTQISPSEKFSSSIGRFNSDSSEVSFPSSISFEQFFSSHNSTPKITNVLNNTATKIWSDLLQSQTQLNIDFQITDLPTGQLAEATITGFDDSGVPNAGTIEIDHDANGVGWFVDSTPEENEEFVVASGGAEEQGSRGEYYLLAAAESEANGKYDLLTTVLHELAHFYGFINGYEGFDANIETEDGTTKFIGDDFEAVLDGEHLDKEAHPYDLLNTHLAPGIRKLPSELNVEILQAILKAEGSPKGLASASRQRSEGDLNAALTSDPLLAIASSGSEVSEASNCSSAPLLPCAPADSARIA